MCSVKPCPWQQRSSPAALSLLAGRTAAPTQLLPTGMLLALHWNHSGKMGAVASARAWLQLTLEADSKYSEALVVIVWSHKIKLHSTSSDSDRQGREEAAPAMAEGGTGWSLRPFQCKPFHGSVLQTGTKSILQNWWTAHRYNVRMWSWSRACLKGGNGCLSKTRTCSGASLSRLQHAQLEDEPRLPIPPVTQS